MTQAVAVKPTERTPPYAFSVFDPTLPLLAAKAALQLDKLRVEPPSSERGDLHVDAVEKLQHMLQGTADTTSVGRFRALVDPLSAQVLSSAVSEYGEKKIESFEELWACLRQLLSLLDPPTLRALEPAQLASIRDFFLVLSNQTAAGQNASSRARPTSRYRKIGLI